MTGLTPTPEQLEIIHEAKTYNQNLLINALAGAAKTTTLVMIAQALSSTPILSLAFNKRIAEEMKKRMPGNVKCQTLNAVGHGVWAQTVPRKLVLATDKNYKILKGIGDGLKRADKEEFYENFSEIRKLVSTAKLAGYVPESALGSPKRLVSREEFWGSAGDGELELESDFVASIVDQALCESIVQSYQGQIDFDDQIYMPTLFGGSFPRFPLVLGDEAQDFSAINLAMLEKLVVARLIAVGDPWQSIYAFRGALSSSMATLRNRFEMKEMNLSISFRCPRVVVERARFRAPHMQYPEWAIQGEFHEPEVWNHSVIPDGAAIICRNNAPLFRLAFILIRAGRGVTVVGSDIGPSLVKALKKLGPEHMSFEEAMNAVGQWEAERLRKGKKEGAIRDKAECLRVFLGIGGNLIGAVAYAESIFKAAGPIQLLSGHKSKGLEWDHVFHLDPDRIPSPYAITDEEIEQELNVRYVIETRAKQSLTLISLDGYDSDA